jgi:phosphoribosylformylglycinamidine synthase PurS subunit
MKAHVYVTLKASVLDPQGQTIHNALRKIGFAEVTAVRQGKYFALSLADSLNAPIRRALRLNASRAKSSPIPSSKNSPTRSKRRALAFS